MPASPIHSAQISLTIECVYSTGACAAAPGYGHKEKEKEEENKEEININVSEWEGQD